MSTVTETTTTEGDGFRKTHTTISTTTFRQSAAPHNLIITRTSGALLGSPSSISSRTVTRSTGLGSADIGDFTSGEYSLKTAHGVGEVKSSRDQEKKELQDLNERFSNYLDKV